MIKLLVTSGLEKFYEESTNVYRGIWLIAAVALWFTAEKKERHAAPSIPVLHGHGECYGIC